MAVVRGTTNSKSSKSKPRVPLKKAAKVASSTGSPVRKPPVIAKPSPKSTKKSGLRTGEHIIKGKQYTGEVAPNRGRQAKTAKSQARQVIRKATRRAVRKGISGPTEDSLGITKNEGSRRLQKAVKTLGYDKATKTAAKTRMRRGQTYKGGKGWR